MKVQSFFANVYGYAFGIEDWIKKFYKEVSGRDLTMTFASDFAIADWFGVDEVKETYQRVKESWLSDYKAFTEVAIALIYLSYAHNQLKEQGFENQSVFIGLYENMWLEARKDFYDYYKDNKEAQQHFFDWTD